VKQKVTSIFDSVIDISSEYAWVNILTLFVVVMLKALNLNLSSDLFSDNEGTGMYNSNESPAALHEGRCGLMGSVFTGLLILFPRFSNCCIRHIEV